MGLDVGIADRKTYRTVLYRRKCYTLGDFLNNLLDVGDHNNYCKNLDKNDLITIKEAVKPMYLEIVNKDINGHTHEMCEKIMPIIDGDLQFEDYDEDYDRLVIEMYTNIVYILENFDFENIEPIRLDDGELDEEPYKPFAYYYSF